MVRNMNVIDALCKHPVLHSIELVRGLLYACSANKEDVADSLFDKGVRINMECFKVFAEVVTLRCIYMPKYLKYADAQLRALITYYMTRADYGNKNDFDY
jgi:hypothetical protein